MIHLHITIAIFSMFSIGTLFAQRPKEKMEWRIAGSLPSLQGQQRALGLAGPVCGIHENVLLVAGGANFPAGMPWEGGKKVYHQTIYAFDRHADQLDGKILSQQLPEPNAYAATCTTPVGVFYAGGENEKGITDKAYLASWDKLTEKVSIVELPSLPSAVTNASAASFGSKVFIIGGEHSTGVSNLCYMLDLDNKAAGWVAIPPLPKPISHAFAAVMESACMPILYVLGGRSKTSSGISEIYASVYALSLGNNEWKTFPSLPYPLCAGTGIVEDVSHILLFGGERGTTFTQVEQKLVDIAKTSNPIEKENLIRQKNALLSTHPGFSRQILRYDVEHGKTRKVGTLPFDAPVTTSANIWGQDVVIPSGEIRAGIRTPNILLAKRSRK